MHAILVANSKIVVVEQRTDKEGLKLSRFTVL
jgi:hypothetical protein